MSGSRQKKDSYISRNFPAANKIFDLKNLLQRIEQKQREQTVDFENEESYKIVKLVSKKIEDILTSMRVIAAKRIAKEENKE